MDNLTAENFVIAGEAMAKMAGFFWPVLLAGFCFMCYEHFKDTADA